MFRKLLKYDMQPIWRIWVWMAAAVVLVSFPCAFGMRLMISELSSASPRILLAIPGYLGFLLNYFVVAAFLVATEVLVFLRFYKHFFSDQGYLTFTLPVSRAKLLASKTVNAMLWMVFSAGVVGICAVEYVLIVPPEFVLFDALGGLLKGIWESGGLSLIFLAEMVLVFLSALWLTTSVIQLCITVASILVKRLKLLVAVGIYYVVNVVLSTAFTVLFYVGLFVAIGSAESIIANVTDIEGTFLLVLVPLAVAVILATVSCFLHLFTLDKLERRLNLT